MKKEDRLKKLNAWFITAENAFNPWAIVAKEDLDFYLGGEKQWSGSNLEKLKKEQRPALTFNHLLSLTNLVAGHQRQNRQDTKIYNRKGGSKNVAGILTEVIKHIYDNCKGDWETSAAFVNGLISHKGYIEVDIDYDEDILNGDIILKSLSPFDVYPDPFFERYDMSDGQYIFQVSWLPKSKIELTYPDKKKELENLNTGDTDRQIIPFVGEGGSGVDDTYKSGEEVATSMTEIERYRFRVKRCWWKEYKEQKFLVGIESGAVRQTDLSNERLKAIEKNYPNIKVIKRVRPILHKTTYVGDVELEHIEDPLDGITKFPIVPFFCYWVQKNHFGLLTQLKDPQREVNKRISQALHHLNQSANSGYIADRDAVDDWEEEERNQAKAGHITKIKPGARFEKKVPTQISVGHLTLSQTADQLISKVSGVNPALEGLGKDKQESGYLMELRRNQGLVSLETIFDNFRLTKQILGSLLVDMIQKTDAYSREEMLTLVLDGEVKEIELQEKIVEEGIEKIKNDLTIGKYKCVVAASPSTPTQRLREFAQLLEAVKAGLPIPPEVLIKASDLKDKEEIIGFIQQQREAEAEAERGKQSAGGQR